MAIVGVFALGVGVVDNEPYSWPRSALWSFGRPLEHFQIAVGVAECKNWMAADESINADHFARTVVDELDFGCLHEHRLTIVQVIFNDAAAADDLLGRNAVGPFDPRPHELDTAARDDK